MNQSYRMSGKYNSFIHVSLLKKYLHGPNHVLHELPKVALGRETILHVGYTTSAEQTIPKILSEVKTKPFGRERLIYEETTPILSLTTMTCFEGGKIVMYPSNILIKLLID